MDEMEKIILYHGTPNKEVSPTYGLGDNKHDYGCGFYLTESIDLAKEWAVCRPNETNSCDTGCCPYERIGATCIRLQ